METSTVLIFALLAVVAQGQTLPAAVQTGQFPTFPFCQCQKAPGAYELDRVVKFKGNGTYCFTIRINVPAGCNNYCCNQADLRKFEINANPSCNIPGILLSSTVNGALVSAGPSIELAPQGPNGSALLKITQLGLNLTNARGAEVCITLRTSRGGRGCTTLDDVCLPPPGSPPGTCTVALFSSNTDCCPTTDVRPPSPPSPPPPPPSPPPPPPQCEVCVGLGFSGNGPLFSFTSEICNAYKASVAARMALGAAQFNARIVRPFDIKSCGNSTVKICGSLASAADAKRLISDANQLSKEFGDLVKGPNNCPPYLSSLTVTSNVTGVAAGVVVLAGGVSLPCSVEASWPPYKCLTGFNIMPFAPKPFYTTQRGHFPNSTQYCFSFVKINPIDGYCSNTTTFSRMEVWASESIRRSATNGFAIKPAGAANFTFNFPNWGGRGSEILKAGQLNFSLQQADGAKVCMEIDDDVSLDEVCQGPFSNTCFILMLDPRRKCCARYPITNAPYIPS